MIKILIVEDDVPISNLIKLNLKLANYNCEVVYNGAEALIAIEKDNFSI